MRCAAGEMYVGSYHAALRRYAEAIGKVYILSAKYGLMELSTQIEPYNLRMGDQGCVTTSVILQQATRLGLLECDVIALGGRDYTRICRAVWPTCKTPLDGVGGIGKQLAWLKRNTPQVAGCRAAESSPLE